MPKDRTPEIDWLKGFAIVCVIINHSAALDGTWAYDYVITRAVPIFLVLFGMNAQSWWSARATSRSMALVGEWLASRLRRLMIPYWAAVTVWWTVVFVYTQDVPPRTTGYIVASYAGYIPWVTTYWFVTLILECVLLFPVILLVMGRIGTLATLTGALAITIGSAFSFLEVIHWGQIVLGETAPNAYSYFWMFFPAYLWHIVSGAAISRHSSVPSMRTAFMALIAYLSLTYIHSNVDPGPAALAVQLLGDVPLAVVLFAGMRIFRKWPGPAGVLAACGGASWGLYLGHILAHETFHLLGFHPDWGSTTDRWMYAGALLVTGIGLVTLGQAARQQPLWAWIPTIGSAVRRA